MRPQLEVREGRSAGRRTALEGEIVLGRAVPGTDLLSDDPEVSRRHAAIRTEPDGRMVVQDLGSANGTWLNGRRISSPQALAPGDVLTVGRTTFHVLAAPPEPDGGGAPTVVRPAPDEITVIAHGRHVTVVSGGGATSGRRLALDDELVLGRTVEGDGRLAGDPEVSRRHARLAVGSDGAIALQDLGSANGTWLNGTRITGSQHVRDGDEIRVGDTTLVVSIPGPPAHDATRVVAPEPPPSAPPEADHLRVLAGAAMGRRISPAGEVVLGRDVDGPGGLGSDPEASRRHARVWRGDQGELVVEDLGSANGTWVNGVRIEGSRPLAAGDRMRVGQTVLLVVDAEGRIATPTQPSGEAVGPPTEAPPAGEQLEIVEGAGVGRRVPIEDGLLLGRAVAGPGRIPDDPEISRRHARIRRGEDGELSLEDLSSENGAWVNGTRIAGARRIGAGDRLLLGRTTFVVTTALGEVPAPSAAGAAPRRRRGDPFAALAAFIGRRRRLILALGVVFVVVAGVVGGPVATLLKPANDFIDESAPSLAAERRLAAAAGNEPAPRVIALVRAANGVVGDPRLDARARDLGRRAQRLERQARAARERAATPQEVAEAGDLAARAQTAAEQARAARRRAGRARDAETRETARRVQAALRADPAVDRVVGYYDTGSPAFVSSDRRSTYLAAFLKPDPDEGAVADRLGERLEGERRVTLGGAALAGPAVGDQAEKDLRAAETIALPLLLVLSLFVFRGFVAALLPLAVGIVTVLGTFLGLRLVNEVQPQSVFALNMVVGLGLGLSIDYSLFILSRYREELARSGPGLEPLRRTLQTAGRTVMFSSVTVSAALTSLLVFPQRFLQSMGTGGLICTQMAATAALVLLPALLALLGPRVNALAPRSWQRATERAARGERAGFWYRLSQTVMRRPLPIATACAALLIAAGLPFLGIRFVGVDASVLPASSPARQVQNALADDFSRNPAAPISVAVSAPRDARARLVDYASDLEKLPGVSAVAAPQRLDDRTWQIDVTPEQGSFDDRTRDVVQRIRDGDAPFPVSPAGEAAAFADQQDGLAERLPFALAILLASTLTILFLMTGSVVLPVKSVLMNFLGLSATFGLLVLIFQDGRLEGPLGYTSQGALNATQPILLFIVAFGLSTDYGVFLLTRIKELHDAGASNDEAVAMGLERTGRIVTAAALLFSVALGAFATSEIVFVKLVGVGAVLAVLIDATIIRAILVPALMAMLGERNWWAPAPLRRLHDAVGLSES